MLKILWKRGEIAPEEQFLLSSTIFYYLMLMLDFYVKTRIRFSLRDKQLFEITEVEITRVDCSFVVFEDKAMCRGTERVSGSLQALHGPATSDIREPELLSEDELPYRRNSCKL